jgi:DNA-binding NtrC family response regulator
VLSTLAEAKPLANDTVLVVEQDVLVRAAIAEYLRDCGYRVFEASTADEAAVILQKSGGEVDVVLTEIKTSGSLNGFGLSQWIRTNCPGVEVILVGTPQRAAAAAGDLCEDGPQGARPYDPQIVLDRIKQLLAARDRNRPR